MNCPVLSRLDPVVDLKVRQQAHDVSHPVSRAEPPSRPMKEPEGKLAMFFDLSLNLRYPILIRVIKL